MALLATSAASLVALGMMIACSVSSWRTGRRGTAVAIAMLAASGPGLVVVVCASIAVAHLLL